MKLFNDLETTNKTESYADGFNIINVLVYCYHIFPHVTAFHIILKINFTFAKKFLDGAINCGNTYSSQFFN